MFEDDEEMFQWKEFLFQQSFMTKAGIQQIFHD